MNLREDLHGDLAARRFRIIQLRHDSITLWYTRNEDTVIADKMNARRRNQRRQLGDERERRENDVRRAIAPTPLELIQQLAVT